MFIWSRIGILYPLLWAVVAVPLFALMDGADLTGSIGHRFTAVVILVAVSVANFFAADAEEDSGHVSSLFYIPMPIWSMVGLGAAIAVSIGLIPVK